MAPGLPVARSSVLYSAAAGTSAADSTYADWQAAARTVDAAAALAAAGAPSVVYQRCRADLMTS